MQYFVNEKTNRHGVFEKNIIKVISFDSAFSTNRTKVYECITAFFMDGNLEDIYFNKWVDEFFSRPATDDEINLFCSLENKQIYLN